MYLFIMLKSNVVENIENNCFISLIIRQKCKQLAVSMATFLNKTINK